jgi:hypothetical protein
VAVVQAAEAEAKKSLVIARVEVSERGGVTRLAALYEGAVALEVDVVAEAGQLFLAERQCPVPSPSLRASRGVWSHYGWPWSVLKRRASNNSITGVGDIKQQTLTIVLPES